MFYYYSIKHISAVKNLGGRILLYIGDFFIYWRQVSSLRKVRTVCIHVRQSRLFAGYEGED